ncbi:uncharacterized protein LOC120574692 isoform X2 [Perca fluviatilis]|uniref:uncharacterized protein LOC120574692 isoform X2 n=1 Tax=Perca fluviatilis TaxID=8168 RepID=UPI001962C950|nr:uncharacterized protein LOC120574692 isoform X2 [Perca fluviatilis]
MDDLNKTFPLVITNDFKDTIECTLEKKYKQDNHKRIRDLLNDCFYRHGDFNKLIRTGKCTGETQNISFYNFMWLMGKAVDYTKGSDLDTVCQVYKTSPHTDNIFADPETSPNKFRANAVILMLLVQSLICNMALLLVVYRYRRRQSRWDRNQWVRNPTHGSDENLPGDEEFQSLCVTQPPQCDFVLTHSAVVNGNSADAEEGTQL